MKNLLPLILIALIVAFTPAALADKSKKSGVPPGLQKKGGLPPGQAKKHGNDQPPSDVLVTNEPITSVASRPMPMRPAEPSKRVESPRGKENSQATPQTMPASSGSTEAK